MPHYGNVSVLRLISQASVVSVDQQRYVHKQAGSDLPQTMIGHQHTMLWAGCEANSNRSVLVSVGWRLSDLGSHHLKGQDRAGLRSVHNSTWTPLITRTHSRHWKEAHPVDCKSKNRWPLFYCTKYCASACTGLLIPGEMLNIDDEYWWFQTTDCSLQSGLSMNQTLLDAVSCIMWPDLVNSSWGFCTRCKHCRLRLMTDCHPDV